MFTYIKIFVLLTFSTSLFSLSSMNFFFVILNSSLYISFHPFLLTKWSFHIDIGCYLFLRDLIVTLVCVRLQSFSCVCDYCHLRTVGGCVILVQCFGFRHCGAAFICV